MACRTERQHLGKTSQCILSLWGNPSRQHSQELPFTGTRANSDASGIPVCQGRPCWGAPRSPTERGLKSSCCRNSPGNRTTQTQPKCPGQATHQPVLQHDSLRGGAASLQHSCSASSADRRKARLLSRQGALVRAHSPADAEAAGSCRSCIPQGAKLSLATPTSPGRGWRRGAACWPGTSAARCSDRFGGGCLGSRNCSVSETDRMPVSNC